MPDICVGPGKLPHVQYPHVVANWMHCDLAQNASLADLTVQYCMMLFSLSYPITPVAGDVAALSVRIALGLTTSFSRSLRGLLCLLMFSVYTPTTLTFVQLNLVRQADATLVRAKRP